MLFLMLDNTTNHVSVALCQDQQVITQLNLPNAQHQQSILQMLDTFIQQGALKTLAHLECIACGIGPGSYTGTRLACSITQALSFALQIPTVAFSSLLAIALTAYAHTAAHVYTVFVSANIDYVYYGIYVPLHGHTIAEGICRKEAPAARALAQGVVLDFAQVTGSTMTAAVTMEVVHSREYVLRLIKQKAFTPLVLPQYYQEL